MPEQGSAATHTLEGHAVIDLTMPAIYVQHLAREVADPGALFAGTRLKTSDLQGPGARISVGDNLRCVNNATRMAGQPSWYQEWATRIAEHFHGPLTPAWLSAPTLGDGLDLFVRHFPARIPYMAIRADEAGTSYALEVRPLIEVGPLLPLLVEVPLLILEQYLGTIRNSRGQGARTELSYRAPAHYRSYQRWFESDVTFECGRNALVIPAAWRDIPNLGYDEVAWRAALVKCEANHDPQSARWIVNRLRAGFYAAFDDRDAAASMPTLETMAAALDMSPRTLIRRLRSIGTTFQDERDAVRKIRARELMETGALSICAISDLLLFSDPPNFGKAFRRWFGTSPSDYRATRETGAGQNPDA